MMLLMKLNDVSGCDAYKAAVTAQIPAVIYKLKSLMQLFLRFNRIRAIENDIRKLKVCSLSIV